MSDAVGSNVVIYGLGRCDTTRKALNWLSRFGVAHDFIDYREHRIPATTLRCWAELVGWENLINRQSKTWRDLLPSRKNPASEPEFLLLIKEHPTLIKRPVLVVEGRPTFGFSDRLYRTLFEAQSDR